MSLDFSIRPVKVEDAVSINEIRRMDGVGENMLSLPSERIVRTEDFIKGLNENDHLFVAEVEENGIRKVVGLAGLHVGKGARLRHTAGVGMMVHIDYQGKGIGTALMNKITDLADNWLMLLRIELDVFIDNERAIKLYKKAGFEIEGTKKYSAVKNGKYADIYLMARYNHKMLG